MFDAVVLGALLWVKARSDLLVLWAAGMGLVLVFLGERLFLRSVREEDEGHEHGGAP